MDMSGLFQKIVHEADHRKFVGRNIMLARTAVGCKQVDWSRKYGLGAGSKLANWEAGAHYPNVWVLLQICDDYGFTLDWFFRGVLSGVTSERADGLRKAEAEIPEA